MKSSRLLKIAAAALLVGVLVYFVFQIYNYFHDPFSTTLTYAYTVETAVGAEGYIVRDEETLPASGGALRILRSEGDKVGFGQTLAMSYASQSDLATVDQLNTLSLQLQQQQFALSTYLDADAALKLDSTITASLTSLQTSLQAQDYSTAEEDAATLKGQILKRDYSAESQEEIEAQIQTTQSQIDTLNASLSGATAITANRPGTYSAVCDGYESVLKPDALSTLTPSALRSLAATGDKGGVGKMIYGSTWYYAAEIDSKDASQFAPGDTSTLRFSKGLDQELTVSVVSVSAEESGRCVVVFSCNKYLSQTTFLRRVSGELVLKTYQGLRLPSSAVRVDETGQSGVYCVVGVTARFKPVELVYQGSDFCLVRAAAKASTTTLRPGDEVIVTAGQLVDGQVIK
jgi:putative membrane fusion protein